MLQALRNVEGARNDGGSRQGEQRSCMRWHVLEAVDVALQSIRRLDLSDDCGPRQGSAVWALGRGLGWGTRGHDGGWVSAHGASKRGTKAGNSRTAHPTGTCIRSHNAFDWVVRQCTKMGSEREPQRTQRERFRL